MNLAWRLFETELIENAAAWARILVLRLHDLPQRVA